MTPSRRLARQACMRRSNIWPNADAKPSASSAPWGKAPKRNTHCPSRYAYAYQALGAYGLNTANAYIQSDWSVEAGIEVAHKLAASGMQYDALCCMNDELALGVMRGLAECGVNVPDDVAVIGFDGVGCGSYTTPTLSTIAVDFDGMAQTAATMMQQQIEQDATERNNSIPKRIIVGFQHHAESTMGRTASPGFTTKTRTEATMTADES